MKTEDLAWLGGILDGEGSFITWRHSGGFYGFRISVRNSSKSMIDEVARILTANGLAFRLRDVGVPNTKGSIVKSKKPMWDLHIDGIKRVKRALDVLLPHIRSKQDQAILLWHFATHRLEQGHFGGYSVFDDWCSKRLREIKNSSETMSVAEIYSDDIVRPALKGVEVAEMSTRQFEKLVRK